MKSISPPNSFYISAAEGWLMLGNPVEAAAELEKITPDVRAKPEVLQLQWQIFARQKQWVACLETASVLIKMAPKRPFGWIHRSYSLHELKRTQEAYDNLLPAVIKFPRVATIAYNLACYSCQLGNLQEAWRWLEKAMKINPPKQIQAMALEDADLQPLWSKIRELSFGDGA